jgi:hypothetical protein
MYFHLKSNDIADVTIKNFHRLTKITKDDNGFIGLIVYLKI